MFFTWNFFFFCLCISSTFGNVSPLCFSYSPYLCFWQLAASVHSIRVQRPVTKTIRRGTTGHPDCSYWHEWPEPRGAIQICKGIILLLLLLLLAYIIEHWWNGTFLESDSFRVRDITTFVEKGWTVSFLFSNDLLYFLCKIYNSTYFLNWAGKFPMFNSNHHLETHSAALSTPWSIKMLHGELSSYRWTFDLIISILWF